MKNLGTLIILASIVMTGCTKDPKASFAASTTDAIVGDNIDFTNTSEEAGSYKWDFGDRTESTVESPSHIYDEVGTYIVKLTAYAKKEKKFNETTSTISVKAKTANVVGTYSVTINETSDNCPAQTLTYDFVVREHPSADSVYLDNFANRFDGVHGSYDATAREITNRVTSGADDGNGGKHEVQIENNTFSADFKTITVNYRMFNFQGGGNCGIIRGSGSGMRK